MGLRDRLRRLVRPPAPSDPQGSAPGIRVPSAVPSEGAARRPEAPVTRIELATVDRVTAMRWSGPGPVVVAGPEEDAAAVVERLRARGVTASWEIA